MTGNVAPSGVVALPFNYEIPQNALHSTICIFHFAIEGDSVAKRSFHIR